MTPSTWKTPKIIQQVQEITEKNNDLLRYVYGISVAFLLLKMVRICGLVQVTEIYLQIYTCLSPTFQNDDKMNANRIESMHFEYLRDAKAILYRFTIGCNRLENSRQTSL